MDTNDQLTRLQTACYYGRTAECTELLVMGADPNDALATLQYTALMFAVMQDSAECAKALLVHGADASKRNNKGRSALDMALFLGARKCQQILQFAADACGAEQCTA